MKRTLLLTTLLATPAFADQPQPQPLPYPPAIPAPQDVAYPGTIQLSVDVTDLARHVVRVHEVIPVQHGGDVVRLYPEGVPGEHAYNPIGSVHGGYAATLLDSACGCAVHSKLSAGQTYTTLELKVAFHKAVTKETGTVRAEGRVISFGRRAAFAEAKITDVAGRLYASATSTLLVMTL